MAFGLGFAGGFAHAASESANESQRNRLQMMQLAQELQSDQLRNAALQQQMQMAPLEKQLKEQELETGKLELRKGQQLIDARATLLNDPTATPQDRALAAVAPESYAAMKVKQRMMQQAMQAAASSFSAMAQGAKTPRERMAWTQAARMAQGGAPQAAINAVLKAAGIQTDDALEAQRQANTALLLWQMNYLKTHVPSGGGASAPSIPAATTMTPGDTSSSPDSDYDSLSKDYGLGP